MDHALVNLGDGNQRHHHQGIGDHGQSPRLRGLVIGGRGDRVAQPSVIAYVLVQESQDLDLAFL